MTIKPCSKCGGSGTYSLDCGCWYGCNLCLGTGFERDVVDTIHLKPDCAGKGPWFYGIKWAGHWHLSDGGTTWRVLAPSQSASARELFPEAGVLALWEAVDLLGGSLLCKRPHGNVECGRAAPFGHLVEEKEWCSPCRTRVVLGRSHQAVAALRIWQSARLDPSDPNLTIRERVLVAVQTYSDACRRGTPDQQRKARSSFYVALDDHELWIARGAAGGKT